MSEYILTRIFPEQKFRWMGLLTKLSRSKKTSFVLSEIHDFLAGLSSDDWIATVSEAPEDSIEPVWLNYVCAMLELAASQKKVAPPEWTKLVEPLNTPYYASELLSLRLHLLTSAPPPFRKRRLFIDASVGDRV